MNVLGICGSPHPKGNTAYALRYALEVIEGEGIDAVHRMSDDQVKHVAREILDLHELHLRNLLRRHHMSED